MNEMGSLEADPYHRGRMLKAELQKEPRPQGQGTEGRNRGIERSRSLRLKQWASVDIEQAPNAVM